MDEQIQGWSLGELASLLGGTVEGDANLRILRPVAAGTADPQGITFAEDARFLAKIRGTQIGAVLLGPNVAEPSIPVLRVAHPRNAFHQLLAMCEKPCPFPVGVHPSAVVDPAASISATAVVGPLVYVGPRCTVGERTVIHPGVRLLQDVSVGADCIIHAGATIGAPGFGYTFAQGAHQPVPQIGGVLIGDRVEIGANTCIDRATVGFTTIGTGTKIDNLCQIGHNVKIGQHVVIAGMSALAGSVTVGNYVAMGGHTAVKEHVTIADQVQIGGRTDVAANIDERGAYWGPHQLPVKAALRVLALHRRLPELWDRLKRLEDKSECE